MSHQHADQIGRRLKNISKELKKYLETRIELYAVSLGDNYTRLLAKSIQKIAGIFILTVALLFILVALALFLGELLDSRSLGYVITSIPLFIGGFLLYKNKSRSLTSKIKEELEEDLVQLLRDDDTEQQTTNTIESPQRLKENEKYDGRK